jgi:hypothetical protein
MYGMFALFGPMVMGLKCETSYFEALNEIDCFVLA